MTVLYYVQHCLQFQYIITVTISIVISANIMCIALPSANDFFVVSTDLAPIRLSIPRSLLYLPNWLWLPAQNRPPSLPLSILQVSSPTRIVYRALLTATWGHGCMLSW